MSGRAARKRAPPPPSSSDDDDGGASGDDDASDSSGGAAAAPAAVPTAATAGGASGSGSGGGRRGGAGAGGAAAERRLREFWAEAMREIEAVPPTADLAEFKNHQLPLARIKKIMKSDEDVRMISAEAPVLFAKACELFVLELALKAWLAADAAKRRTLTRADFAAVVARTLTLDFLDDVVADNGNGEGGEGGGGAN